MAEIVLQSVVGRELTPAEADENIRILHERTAEGWYDLTSGFHMEGIDPVDQPTYKSFGSSGLRKEKAFALGNYAFCEPYHINHDVKVGGKAYIHIHWSTSGIDTNSVKWEFQISRAKGHDQEYFSAETSYFIEVQPNQTASGAWRHLIAEITDVNALVLLEPDELILVTTRRVTNGATDNTDDIFGLTCDFHYERDRYATPNKAPDFYN